MTASALRAILGSDRLTHAPGVHDPVTAALAAAAGHRAVHLSAAAVSATMLGRPDAGYTPGTQLADRASTLVPALHGIPLIADAGTGYDTPRDAVWTALAYARAGVSGLYLDDRPGPERLGNRPGPQTIELGAATARITALTRQVPHIVVIARTGVHATHGLGETIVRCRAYAEAGADAVVPDGVDDPEDLRSVHAALPGVPLVINRSETSRSETGGERPRGDRPGRTDADLAAAGVRLVLHPVAALLAALRAVSLTYRAIADGGTADTVDRMPWAAVTALADREGASGPDSRYVPGGLHT